MRKFSSWLIITLVGTLMVGGVVYAASFRNITSKLGGVSGDSFDLDGALTVDSLKVGAQGVGGVTYFNGTIINSTTGTGGVDNPVAFGDNVRIDGNIYRGATAGPGDNYPLKLNDDVKVYGNLTMSENKTLDLTGVTITGLLNEAKTITGNWVNTANPWSADEIANVTRRVEIPLASFLTDADGTPASVTAITVPNLAYTANQGLALVYSATETTDIGAQFTVPADYVADGVFKAIVDTSGSIVADANLDFKVAISQTTGTAAWDTDMDDETAVDVPSNPSKPSVVTFTPTDRADFSVGDTVLFDLFPASYIAGEPDIEIYSAWFEYTASQ